MKRLTYVRVIVLGLALTTAPVGAGTDDDRSVTAAASGLFAAGAELGPVALQGVQIATGVFIEADGSASGTFHAVLQGSSLGGPQEITVEGNVTGGSVDADGRATFSGSASLDLGDGSPPLANVAFTVTAGSDDVVLVVDSVTLTARLAAGAVTID